LNLFLIRHPKPLAAEGLCYGRLDLPVAAEVLDQSAIDLRQRLGSEVLAHAVCFTSPSTRCAGLARALCAPHSPQVAASLMEMDFGSWEGLEWASVPRCELDAWAKDLWHYRPGGGESADSVLQRWTRWCAELRNINGAPVVAVTHAGIIRVALAQHERASLPEVMGRPIPYGSVHPVRLG
jgi:alpha-ribazole phosphatase